MEWSSLGCRQDEADDPVEQGDSQMLPNDLKRSPEYLIAANQVFGAVLLTDAYTLALARGASLPMFLVLGAFTVAALGGVAGLLLWRRHSNGLTLSLFAQGVQIFGVAGTAFDLRVKLGVNVTVEVSQSALMTHWGFNGFYDVGPWGGMPQFTVTFNALALISFIYLLRLRRREGAPQIALKEATHN